MLVLVPGRFVGAEKEEDEAEPFLESYPRLVADLEECLAEGDRLTTVVRGLLAGIRVDG